MNRQEAREMILQILEIDAREPDVDAISYAGQFVTEHPGMTFRELILIATQREHINFPQTGDPKVCLVCLDAKTYRWCATCHTAVCWNCREQHSAKMRGKYSQ